LLEARRIVGFTEEITLGSSMLGPCAGLLLLLNNDTVVDPSFLTTWFGWGKLTHRSGPSPRFSMHPSRRGFVCRWRREIRKSSSHHVGKDQFDQTVGFPRHKHTAFVSGGYDDRAEVLREIVVRQQLFTLLGG